jgi:hypothetical protein
LPPVVPGFSQPPPLPPAPPAQLQNPYAALSSIPPGGPFMDFRAPPNHGPNFGGPPSNGHQNFGGPLGHPQAHINGHPNFRETPNFGPHNFGGPQLPGGPMHFSDYPPQGPFLRPPMRRSRSPRNFYGREGPGRSRSPPRSMTAGRNRSRSPLRRRSRSKSRDKSPRRADQKGKVRMTVNEKSSIDCRYFSSKQGCSRGDLCHFRHIATSPRP